ncbi:MULTISPECIES: hypothetical protein [Rhizobium]|uniref:hypothetical protein n=1 Tax=Rhizobium TaxID=379 RepID=UPI001EF8F8AB|nr:MULTISPECIES: hypothetical protein [Rhizobium]ULJ82553.1 hypothetical protein MF410_32515 [Rhizobium sp. C104]
MGFDQYVITCVLSRALEEVEAGEATATEVTGFRRLNSEMRYPTTLTLSFAVENVRDAEVGVE